MRHSSSRSVCACPRCWFGVANRWLRQVVNPADHSIAHLAILNTLKHCDEAALPFSPDVLREHILKFLLSFDQRQIRYVGDVFYDLVKDVLDCKYFPVCNTLP